MHKYKILGKKGEGTFAKVLTARVATSNEVVAIKCMKSAFETEDQVENLREMRALHRLMPHPNIVTLREIIFDRTSLRLAFVFELMEMNLYEVVRAKRQFFNEAEVRYFMFEIMKGIEHMHHKGLFHRDVKPENILINRKTKDLPTYAMAVAESAGRSEGAEAAGYPGPSSGGDGGGATAPPPASTSASAFVREQYEIKLADFGSSKGIFSEMPYTEYISTRWYRAPECLITDGYYSEKMDIWGAACVFFELMTLCPLFPGSSELDQINRIHSILGTPPREVLDKLMKLSTHIDVEFAEKPGTGLSRLLPNASPEAFDVLQWMLTYDMEQRPTARQVLKHAYFKQLRSEEVQKLRGLRQAGEQPARASPRQASNPTAGSPGGDEVPANKVPDTGPSSPATTTERQHDVSSTTAGAVASGRRSSSRALDAADGAAMAAATAVKDLARLRNGDKKSASVEDVTATTTKATGAQPARSLFAVPRVLPAKGASSPSGRSGDPAATRRGDSLPSLVNGSDGERLDSPPKTGGRTGNVYHSSAGGGLTPRDASSGTLTSKGPSTLPRI